MKKSLLTSTFIFFILLSFAQVDIGIKNLKVIKPYDVIDGESLNLGDTIEQIQFEVFNYSSSDLSSSDLSSYQVEFNYNGTARLAAFTLIGTISANSGRQEKMPEFIGNPSFLPKFPTSASSVEVCVTTNANGDANNSNDKQCITINIGSTGIDQTIQKTNYDFYLENGFLNALEPRNYAKVLVLDVTGNLVKESNNFLNNKLEISSLPAGLYFVSSLQKDGDSRTQKIVKAY